MELVSIELFKTLNIRGSAPKLTTKPTYSALTEHAASLFSILASP